MGERCSSDGQTDAVIDIPGPCVGRPRKRFCPSQRRRLRISDETSAWVALPWPRHWKRQTRNQRVDVGRLCLFHQINQIYQISTIPLFSYLMKIDEKFDENFNEILFCRWILWYDFHFLNFISIACLAFILKKSRTIRVDHGFTFESKIN